MHDEHTNPDDIRDRIVRDALKNKVHIKHHKTNMDMHARRHTEFTDSYNKCMDALKEQKLIKHGTIVQFDETIYQYDSTGGGEFFELTPAIVYTA